MLFAEFLQTVRDLAANNLPIATGGAVAVVVLAALVVINLRRRRRAAGLASPAGLVPAAGTGEEKALNWAPPEQSYADRRGSARREGPPVRVLLSSPTFRNGVSDGFVLDRSTG